MRELQEVNLALNSSGERVYSSGDKAGLVQSMKLYGIECLQGVETVGHLDLRAVLEMMCDVMVDMTEASKSVVYSQQVAPGTGTIQAAGS